MSLVYVYGSGECEQLGKSNDTQLKVNTFNSSWTIKHHSLTIQPNSFSLDTGLGDDAPFEIKKPRKPTIFDIGNLIPARSILKLVCGGMHTVALATDGTVWTWGCNDEGALGRKGAENTPLKVSDSLTMPISDISAGDSHTIAYNTKENCVYYWGCYRVSKFHQNYMTLKLNHNGTLRER